MANFIASTLPTANVTLSGATKSSSASFSSPLPASFFKMNESTLNYGTPSTFSSLSATLAPIKIEASNTAPGSQSINVAKTETTKDGSSSSSFSTSLNNLYVGSLPESLLLPFISQQAAVAFNSKSQQQNFPTSLNNQSISTTIHSLLSSQPQYISAFNLQSPSFTLPNSSMFSNEAMSADQKGDLSQLNSNALASSLPPMNMLLNNFISNPNKAFGSSEKEEFCSSKISAFGSSVPSIVSVPASSAATFLSTSMTLNLGSTLINMPGNNSRTTSESSIGDESLIMPTESTAATTAATNCLVPAVENIKLESFSAYGGGERSGSNSPLKMRARLNSKTKTPITDFSPTSPAQFLIEEDQSNICNVCGDEASGRHYGASTCFGCKGFFRRTVRANKTYNCRYEERCEIDKVGRNTCRACRFRKCLEVGMEPDAIRPDRDKTGRQKNPRRSTVLSGSYSLTCETTGEPLSAAPTLEVGNECNLQQQIVLQNPDQQKIQTPASVKLEDSTTLAETMVAERDLVIETLLKIERICAHLRDPLLTTKPTLTPSNSSSLSMLSDSINNNKVEECFCSSSSNSDALFSGNLTQIILQPSLISPRTQLDYSGQHGVLDRSNTELRNDCCYRLDFQRGFRRILTLAVDFANTLTPIADISVYQRENLMRSFISSYVVFTSAFQSVSAGYCNSILLPNGTFITENTPLSTFVNFSGLSANAIQFLTSKINFICKQVIDCLQNKMEKLKMSEVEYVCLKAIIALDPSALGINMATSKTLSGARDSVQNALFLHLMEKFSSQQAVFRFGQLLMLISNVSKIGAFLNNTMESIAAYRNDLANSATLRFFNGLDKLVQQKSLSDEDSHSLTNNLETHENDDRTTDSSDTEMDADDDNDTSDLLVTEVAVAAV